MSKSKVVVVEVNGPNRTPIAEFTNALMANEWIDQKLYDRLPECSCSKNETATSYNIVYVSGKK